MGNGGRSVGWGAASAAAKPALDDVVTGMKPDMEGGGIFCPWTI